MHAVVLIAASAAASDEAPTPASPARRCADSAQGTEVEVCLRLAAENPGAVEEIASALIARLDRADAPDRDLLDAILLLASPRPLDGVAELGRLQDPRAVAVLLQVAQEGPPDVGGAAIATLAEYPSTVRTLFGWLVDRQQPVRIRLAAADALGRMHRRDAADALQDALRRRGMPPQVLEAVAQALTTWYPDRRFELPTSSDGSRWLAGAASTSLAYAMGAGLYFGQPADADPTAFTLWEAGALTGGVAGASLGWFWGRAWPIESGDAALVATTGGGLAVSGALVGAGLRPDDAAAPLDLPLLGGFAGEVVGTSAGFLLKRPYRGTAQDNVEALVVGGLFAGGAEAVGRSVTGDPDGPHLIATGLTLAGGLGVGHLVAPGLEPGRAWPLAATGAAVGLGVGLLAPVDARERDPLLIGGPLLGAGLGASVSALAQPGSDVLAGALTGGVITAGVGGGVGMVASDRPEVGRGLALGGLGLGVGLGAWSAARDPDPIDDRDVAVAFAAASWAAWDTLAIGSLVTREGDREPGAVLVSAGLAAAGATALDQQLDIPMSHTLSATSIGLWGGYAGAAIGPLVGIDDPLVLALPGSNLGLVAGGIVVSPLVGTPPLGIAIADAFGALGASIGATGAGLAGGKSRTVAGWSLAGAALGLTSGGFLGAHWQRDSARRDVAWAWPTVPAGVTATVAPLPVRGGAGLVWEVRGW